MRSVLKLFIFAGLLSALMTGCYPNEDLSYSDLDVAATRYDMDFAFEDNMVCVLFDEVKWAVEDESEIEDPIMNEDVIVAEVTKNLEQTRFDVYVVSDTAELRAKIINGDIPYPDLFVTLSVMQNTITYYYPYYGYGYWYGGWYPYWKSGSLKSGESTQYYPYYPYYPSYGYTYSYTSGTIFMDMLDVSKLEPTGGERELPIVWSGVVNGIESGSKSDHASRITREVKQCFTQSPYLF